MENTPHGERLLNYSLGIIINFYFKVFIFILKCVYYTSIESKEEEYPEFTLAAAMTGVWSLNGERVRFKYLCLRDHLS